VCDGHRSRDTVGDNTEISNVTESGTTRTQEHRAFGPGSRYRDKRL